MTETNFSCNAHAKWILTGEHAVVRGHPAIVGAIENIQLSFTYQTTNTPLQVKATGIEAENLKTHYPKFLNYACSIINTNPHHLKGNIHINNQIPIGQGLGFSAALCVVTTKWFIQQKLISKENWWQIATRLENHFHGKSSGIDILGANLKHNQLMIYQHNKPYQEIHPQWQPILCLKYAGNKGLTRSAVNQVIDINKQHEKKGIFNDNAMATSTINCMHALKSNKTTGLNKLSQAIQQANICFQDWQLITPAMQLQQNQLMQQGALATKPTGSGNGGYILSLWKQLPTNYKTIGLQPIQLNNIVKTEFKKDKHQKKA